MNRFIAEQIQGINRKIQEHSGADRIRYIQEILSGFMSAVLSTGAPFIGAGVLTYKLIESSSIKWLGDAAELASISKSPPGNVTTEMGLALGDAADVVRNHPAVIEYLKHARNATFFDGLKAVAGGEEVSAVLLNFLERYGMRGTGEIDITRPRWREAPTQLVPAILGHIAGVKPGQHRLDFLAGKVEAEHATAKAFGSSAENSGGIF